MLATSKINNMLIIKLLLVVNGKEVKICLNVILNINPAAFLSKE
jgi:hypothetical protein